MTTFLHGVAQQPYAALFRGGLPILGVDGIIAQTQPDAPDAGHVQAKTGSRAGGTPADQVLLTGLTLTGYVEAASGRGEATSWATHAHAGKGVARVQRSGRTVGQ